MLAQKGAQVKEAVEKVPGVIDLRVEQLEGVPQVVIAVDRERAARFGLNASEIGHSVEASLGGSEVTTVIKDQLKEYPVMVRLSEERRNTPEQVSALLIDTPTGQKVLLSDIAAVRVQRGPATIKREDQVRRIQLTMNVEGRDIGSVVRDIEKALTNVKLPPGYFVSYGGGYERQQELASQVASAFTVSALLVFLLLLSRFPFDLAGAFGNRNDTSGPGRRFHRSLDYGNDVQRFLHDRIAGTFWSFSAERTYPRRVC